MDARKNLKLPDARPYFAETKKGAQRAYRRAGWCLLAAIAVVGFITLPLWLK
jgi:hypothetical protein